MTFFRFLAIIATSSSTFVQVTFDQSGIPRIDAEFARSRDLPQTSSHVVHLGVHGVTMIASQLDTNSVRPLLDTELRIPTINSEPIINVRHRWTHSYGILSLIGIGPGSDLLRVWSSIDFVRQSTARGFLRLEGSEDNFITNDCLPDSIMRMETRITEGTYGQHVLTSISVSLGENVTATNYAGCLGSDELILMVPNGLFADIFALLPTSRVRLGTRMVFVDCAETMQRLPVITLTFTAGDLRLLPEDYTRQTGQDDTCELLIGQLPVVFGGGTIRFNPLLIPGINARSTDNEILFCDSAINV